MTQTSGAIAYFLGANTAEGFYSLYDELIDEATASAFYILKGGPGCGKSTLMKTIGKALEQDGLGVEYILCSGDPESLDGILVPEKGVAIMDGTAPHAMAPHPQKAGTLKAPMNLQILRFEGGVLGGQADALHQAMQYGT